MLKLILENSHLKNFVQPSSGLGLDSCRFLTTGFTHGYSNLTTSWFEFRTSLKGLNLNSPGLSAAQPWVSGNAPIRRNQLAVQGCKETMRQEKLRINEDDLLNPPQRRTLREAGIYGLNED